MAITISGQNNNDKILASDGVLDSISGFNVVGVMTAAQFDVTGKTTTNHISIGNNIHLGNAGIITATTLLGNVTGNINHESNLLLQISGSEKFRVGNGGQFGIAGANYGTAGQVFTSGGSGSAPTWSTIASDKITEGNTEAEVVDTGSDGHFKVTTEGSERLRITADGNIGINDNAPANFTGYKTLSIHGSTGGALVFGDDGTDEWEIYGGDGVVKIYDRANTQERIRISDNGAIGLGGANYGSSGQVLTSGGSGSAVSWTTITGTTINSNTNNYLITGTGTANTLQGEANLTFDGTQLKIGGDSSVSGTFGLEIYNTDSNEGTALIAGTAGARLDIMDTGSSERLRIAAAGAAYFISYKSGDPFIFQTTDGSGTAERLRITSEGYLKIGGHSANRDVGGLSAQMVHLEGTSGAASISLINNQNSGGNSALYLGKSRGTSVGSNVILQENDPMGSIVWCGSDGNDMISQGAVITAEVDGTPGSNDMPGRLVFKTTADGAVTPTERLRIDSDGHARFQHGLTGLSGGGVIVCAAKSSSGTANQSNYKVDFVVPMGDLGNRQEYEDIQAQFGSGQTGTDWAHNRGGSGILIATVQNDYYWGFRTKIYHITTYGNATNNVTQINVLHNYSAAGHGGNSASVDLAVQSHDGKTPKLRATFSGDYWNSNILTVTYIGSAVASTGNIRQLTTFDSKLTGQDPTWK